MPTTAISNAQITYTRRSALTAGATIAGTAGAALLTRPAFAGVAGGAHPTPAHCRWSARCRPNGCNRTGASATIPNFPGGYQNRSAVIGRLAGMRIAYIRGMFTSDSMATPRSHSCAQTAWAG